MTDKFQCNFCKREFMRENSLINHICEQKRRWDSKNEQNVRMGFNSWLKWYELSGTAVINNKKYRFEDFMKSKYYLAFVKFGKHIVEAKVLSPELYIKFVIKNKVKLDNWCNEAVYEAYNKDVCKRESVEVALERMVKLMSEWGEEFGEDWTDYFAKVNVNLAVKMIRNGCISPWIVLNANTIYKLFDRMGEEQITMVNNAIDLTAWSYLMKKNEQDRSFVRETLENCKI